MTFLNVTKVTCRKHCINLLYVGLATSFLLQVVIYERNKTSSTQDLQSTCFASEQVMLRF